MNLTYNTTTIFPTIIHQFDIGGFEHIKGQLIDYSNRLGLNHLTLGAQLLFTKYELETFNYLGDGLLRKTDNVKDATIVFQDSYERPNKAAANTQKRINYGKEIFDKLVG